MGAKLSHDVRFISNINIDTEFFTSNKWRSTLTSLLYA